MENEYGKEEFRKNPRSNVRDEAGWSRLPPPSHFLEIVRKKRDWGKSSKRRLLCNFKIVQRRPLFCTAGLYLCLLPFLSCSVLGRQLLALVSRGDEDLYIRDKDGRGEDLV
jgi:hypothetical protein